MWLFSSPAEFGTQIHSPSLWGQMGFSLLCLHMTPMFAGKLLSHLSSGQQPPCRHTPDRLIEISSTSESLELKMKIKSMWQSEDYQYLHFTMGCIQHWIIRWPELHRCHSPHSTPWRCRGCRRRHWYFGKTQCQTPSEKTMYDIFCLFLCGHLAVITLYVCLDYVSGWWRCSDR